MMARLGGAAAAALLAVLGALTVGMAPAAAHSNQVGTSPEDGALLETLPETVRVDFDSPLLDMGVALVVRDAGGASVAVGDPRLERQRISVDLDPDAGPGEYTVAYRVVAEDGHTLEGSFGFTVAGEVASPAASMPASSSAPSAASPGEASAASTAEPLPADVEQDAGPPYLLLGLGALAIVLVAAGALALRR